MQDAAAWTSAGISAVCAVAGFIAWLKAQRAAARAEAAEAQARQIAADHARSAAEQAESLKSLVAQGEAAATRAEESLRAAREHAESAARSATAEESIASVLTPSRLVIEWSSSERFALRNTSSSPIIVKSFTTPDSFVRDPFFTPVTIRPGESVSGAADEAAGYPFPGELVLDVEGEDGPVVVPATGRPAER